MRALCALVLQLYPFKIGLTMGDFGCILTGCVFNLLD